MACFFYPGRGGEVKFAATLRRNVMVIKFESFGCWSNWEEEVCQPYVKVC